MDIAAKIVLLLFGLLFFFVRKESKPALLLVGYMLLSEIQVPFPFGHAIYFLPICYFLSSLIHYREFVSAFKARELKWFIAIVAIGLGISYFTSPHYVASFSQLIRLFLMEFVCKYGVMVLALCSIKGEESIKKVLSAMFTSMIILTVVAVVNQVMQDPVIFKGIVDNFEEIVHRTFADEQRFRVQGLFANPFNYGFMCLVVLQMSYYGYKKKYYIPVRFYLLLAMSVFGIISCGCRTMVICSLFFAVIAFVFNARINRVALTGLIAIILLYISYWSFSPVRNFIDYTFVSLFDVQLVEGSTLGMRIIQFDRVMDYLQETPVFGRGIGFFDIDLHFAEGIENLTDPELFGLEGVYLNYLLERGILGYSLYLVSMVIMLVYLYRNRQYLPTECRSAISLIFVYLLFAHMTGELYSAHLTMFLLGVLLRVIQDGTYEENRIRRYNAFIRKYRFRQLGGA